MILQQTYLVKRVEKMNKKVAAAALGAPVLELGTIGSPAHCLVHYTVEVLLLG